MVKEQKVYSKSLRHIFDFSELASRVHSYSSGSGVRLSKNVNHFNVSKYVEDVLSKLEISVVTDDYNSIILNKDVTVYCSTADYLGHVFYFGSLVQRCLDFLSEVQSFLMGTAMIFSCDADVDDDTVLSTYYNMYEVLDVFSSPAIVFPSEEDKNTLMQSLVRMANFIPVLAMYLRHKGYIASSLEEDERSKIHDVMGSLVSYLVRTSCDVIQMLNKAYVKLENIPVMLDDTKSVVQLKGEVPLVSFGVVFGNGAGVSSQIEKVTSSVRLRRIGSPKKSSSKSDIVEILKGVANDISSLVGQNKSRPNSEPSSSKKEDNLEVKGDNNNPEKNDKDKAEVEGEREPSLAAYL